MLDWDLGLKGLLCDKKKIGQCGGGEQRLRESPIPASRFLFYFNGILLWAPTENRVSDDVSFLETILETVRFQLNT